jgi:hypothetical protein
MFEAIMHKMVEGLDINVIDFPDTQQQNWQ